MNRIQEKVKDIVEVRPYKGLRDFSADAKATLENYCFTDDTSALMAKWLDAACSLSAENGSALALAGYRGVGKSHFLAVFSAIVSLPELRSKVSNSHVAAAAQGLLRRHYPVVSVRRGSCETFVEELKAAVIATFTGDVQFTEETPAAILSAAKQKAGDLPLIVIIDTAMERGSRVVRNDGSVLGEVAEYAKNAGMLICVALDDDIAGADGSNSAIVRTFQIDFLDQEHLYKVVNAHIFPKNNLKQPIVSEIYNYFCKVVPNFRWSEQRFSSLYPLHPGILEVSPFVRLYVHDFALLSFAAEAGERILGRPANSLIAFDEVFDRAEAGLRKIDDLADAFRAYDKLNTDVVSKIPVIQRLQAKLILKALLLLSLNGRGATAEDICASMLIFDENDPPKAIATARSIIKMFSDALPHDIATISDSGTDEFYSFRVSAKETVNSTLQEAISELDPKLALQVIRSIFEERYSDVLTGSESESPERRPIDCIAYWRGSQRRGRVYWRDGTNPEEVPAGTNGNDSAEWEAVIDLSGQDPKAASAGVPASGVVWRPDRLRKDEIEALLRHHLLQTENDILGNYGEHVRASMHSHRVAAEKIFDRVMLTNGQFVIDAFDYNLTEESKAATSLSEVFSSMLQPMFETRFPLHPHFGGKLGMQEVSRLVSDLYADSRQKLDEVQYLARNFSLPLGLVRLSDGLYLPEIGENLEALPSVSEVMKLLEQAGDSTLSLNTLYAKLRQPPFGLVREAQHLVLAALVAERKIEFVTSKGDRINSRSLDLKIIWDDIVGVSKPKDTTVSGKRLIKWAQIFTGDATLKSLDGAESRAKIGKSLAEWLEEWESDDVLGRFEHQSDSLLNTAVWSQAAKLRKTHGAAASEIRSLQGGTATLEDVLSRIADIYVDKEEEFASAMEVRAIVGNHLSAISGRERIMGYLAACEPTGDAKIEDLRRSLVACVETAVSEPGDAKNREVGYLWEYFLKEYCEFYAIRHDQIMLSHDLQEKFDEMRRTDIWWEFENLSSIAALRGPEWREALQLRRKLENLDCNFDVRESLKNRPLCLCAFRLSDTDEWQRLPDALWVVVSRGQTAIRERIRSLSNDVLDELRGLEARSQNQEEAKAAKELASLLRAGSEIPRLSQIQIEVLRLTLGAVGPGSFDEKRMGSLSIEPASKPASIDMKTEPVEEEELLLV